MAMKPFCLKTTVTSLAALTVFFPVAGCDLANNHLKIDRSTNSEFQDYRDALAPREAGYGDQSVASDIPELQPYVNENVDQMPAMPLVSISINQSIPLREALFELAKQADYDIELDPRIQGSVIFTARSKPLDVVIDRICEISGLRYKFDGSTLRIELDTPYSKNYKIDYLSFVRKNSSSMKTDVSVASSSGGESGGVSGGSSFSVSTDSNADFWAELDTNLKQILTANATGSYLKTAQDPTVTLTAVSPAQPPVPPVDATALQEGTSAASVSPQAGTEYYVSSPVSIPADANSTAPAPAEPSVEPDVFVDTSSTPAPVAEQTPVTSSAAPSPVSLNEETTPAPVAPPPTLKIESLPTAAASGGSGVGQNDVAFTPTYSLNKQAGVISVYANERLHKKVQEYLDELKRSSTSQVLIEAKVLEVSLSDEFSAGVDWGMLDRLGDFGFGMTFSQPDFATASTNGVAFSFAGNDIGALVSALSRFGTIHALASPRLTVLNNQSAVLNVARNQVYFELDVQTDVTPVSTGGSTTNTTVDSTIKTVPEGVLINVLPSINLDNRMVAMQVRPTVTKITDYVSDPGAAYASGGAIQSNIPVVNVQEVDSVVNMKSGEVMVMGGLLQDSDSSTQEGVPVAGEIPVFGGLFRNQGDAIHKKELVIFLKATILGNPADSIHQTDRELYRIFSQDRRPEKL